MEAKDLIVVNGIENTTGAIVWWRLAGVTKIEELRGSWDAAGLDQNLMRLGVTPHRALARAMSTMESKRKFIRPLPRQTGWALVQESEIGDSLGHATVAEVRLRAGSVLDTGAMPVEEASRIVSEYERQFGILSTTDISDWLVRTVLPQTMATALRDTGGIYFMPRDYLEPYRRMVFALERVSDHRFFLVPALKTDEAIDAILDSVTRETRQAIEGIELEIDTMTLGKRALDTRRERCEAILAKVRAYERLLGRGMREMTERITSLQAGIVTATLAAMPDQLPLRGVA